MNSKCIQVSFLLDEILKQIKNCNLIIDEKLLKEKLVNRPIIYNNKAIGVITEIDEKFANGYVFKEYGFEALKNDKNEVTSMSFVLMD